MGRARDLANILSSSGNVALDSEMGLSLITPTSIATTGGSATSSISSTGAVSFTSASAISLNDVFSATYDNYKIILDANASNTSSGFSFRLRVSGSDDTNSVYGRQLFFGDGTSVIAARSSVTTSCALADFNSTDREMYHIELINPNKVAPTGYDFTFTRRYNNSSNQGKYFVTGGHTNSTSFTGFTFFVGGAGITFAGTISIYGYKK
jgi:hypothetical protein